MTLFSGLEFKSLKKTNISEIKAHQTIGSILKFHSYFSFLSVCIIVVIVVDINLIKFALLLHIEWFSYSNLLPNFRKDHKRSLILLCYLLKMLRFFLYGLLYPLLDATNSYSTHFRIGWTIKGDSILRVRAQKFSLRIK